VTAGGYFGQALVVDAATGTSVAQPLPDEILRAYVGGSGLGTWLLHRLGTPGAAALDASAPLAFVFSPLVGTPLTTSAKFAVVAKSPLTGMLTDALASSQFAIAGKLTGHDAIVIRGRAPRLSVLLADGDGSRLLDARHLAGRTAAETDEDLRDQLGRGWRVAAIGPAGERGVRYATISHDGRHAGRGGLGTVMGAKNLKAIAVRAAAKVTTADPRRVLAAARDLRERSFGPATAKYRELGTLANLLTFNAIATLPTRNFQAAEFEGADRLAGSAPDEAVEGMRRVARSSCASCTIGCEHIYRVGGGKKARGVRKRLALGPMCGVSDPGAVLTASARCDELGIDTISAGGTIAWAMECARGSIERALAQLRRPGRLAACPRRDRHPRYPARVPARRRITTGIPDRRGRIGFLRPARQRPGDARVRAAHAARDGPGPGGQRAGRGPQPVRRLRGRSVG
jgi:aldehyde:ferredoxin oxidoreductase